MVETGGYFCSNQKHFFSAEKSFSNSFHLRQPLDISWVKLYESRPWGGVLGFGHQGGNRDTWNGNTLIKMTGLCARPSPWIQLLPLPWISQRYFNSTCPNPNSHSHQLEPQPSPGQANKQTREITWPSFSVCYIRERLLHCIVIRTRNLGVTREASPLVPHHQFCWFCLPIAFPLDLFKRSYRRLSHSTHSPCA